MCNKCTCGKENKPKKIVYRVVDMYADCYAAFDTEEEAKEYISKMNVDKVEV